MKYFLNKIALCCILYFLASSCQKTNEIASTERPAFNSNLSLSNDEWHKILTIKDQTLDSLADSNEVRELIETTNFSNLYKKFKNYSYAKVQIDSTGETRYSALPNRQNNLKEVRFSTLNETKLFTFMLERNNFLYRTSEVIRLKIKDENVLASIEISGNEKTLFSKERSYTISIKPNVAPR